MRKIYLLMFLISFNINAQCDWASYFPFQAGNSKFDVAQIKSTNPTIADTEDNYGMRDEIAKINNGFRKFEYLKDSVFINVINLRFVNNSCSKDKSNRIQITLSDDKLHKGIVELHYKDYKTMKEQYDKLLDLVPEEYGYSKPFTTTNSKTNEKIGEGFGYFTKPKPDDGDKINQITIGYKFDFKKVWDKEKSEYYRTNEIENYTIEISLDDLRQTKLTRQGY